MFAMGTPKKSMKVKVNRLQEYGQQVGLKINTNKTESLRNYLHALDSDAVMCNDLAIRYVDKFTCIGSDHCNMKRGDGVGVSHVPQRTQKESRVYYNERKLEIKQYNTRTKFQIFDINVKSGL